MELNKVLPQFEEHGIKVLAISPSPPDKHKNLKRAYQLEFDFVTDVQLIFPSQFGFYHAESQTIQRGFLGINPENNATQIEVNYPFGNLAHELLQIMIDL